MIMITQKNTLNSYSIEIGAILTICRLPVFWKIDSSHYRLNFGLFILHICWGKKEY